MVVVFGVVVSESGRAVELGGRPHLCKIAKGCRTAVGSARLFHRIRLKQISNRPRALVCVFCSEYKTHDGAVKLA